MANKKFWLGMLSALLPIAFYLFVGCQTTIPVSYTEPARLDMSGINRVVIRSDDGSVSNYISQKLSATGKFIVVPASDLREWQDGKKRVDAQAGAVEISAADLVREYQANAARADSSYKGKLLRVSAAVKEIGQSVAGSYFARLDGGADSVDVFFDPTEAGKFISLNKGQTITVIGECNGYTLPDMADTAEILRILGAGRSVNVLKAWFLIEDYPPPPADAVIDLDKNVSEDTGSNIEKRAARDKDGNTIKGADGQPVYQDVTVYYRAVKVDINYKIARLTDDSLIGQGTKSATSPRSTSENQSNLTPASELEAGAIKKPLGELAAEMVPTQRSITLTLAKEAENKAAKKEMNAALKLVKAKDYKGAAAAYGKIYAQYNNFAAGYNQALLVEASDGTEAAIGLMEALIQKTGNAAAQNMLRSMQSRNEANKRAAEQLSQ